MQILSIPASFFTKDKAETLCQHLNSDPDEDWTYKPVHSPDDTGWSKIAVYDEDGIFVAYL